MASTPLPDHRGSFPLPAEFHGVGSRVAQPSAMRGAQTADEELRQPIVAR
jgi:hypothetical protein